MKITEKMLQQVTGDKTVQARSTELSFYVGDMRVELNELDHTIRIDSERTANSIDLTISKSDLKGVIRTLIAAEKVMNSDVEVKFANEAFKQESK